MRFWDSSAVVPLLVHQSQSALADRWWEEDPQAALWALTPTEITSALWRLVRDGALPERDAHQADARGQELAQSCYAVVDLDLVQSHARRLLRLHPLRAADALQLAAGLVWAGDRPEGKTFHTFDARLALAARREGFVVR